MSSRSRSSRPVTRSATPADTNPTPATEELVVPMTPGATLAEAVAESTPSVPVCRICNAAPVADGNEHGYCATCAGAIEGKLAEPFEPGSPAYEAQRANLIAETPAETPAPAAPKPTLLEVMTAAFAEQGYAPGPLSAPWPQPPAETPVPAAPVALATTAAELTAYLDRALTLDTEAGYLYVKATAETVRLYFKADKAAGITFATATFCELVVKSATHPAWQRGLPSRPKGQWGTMKQRLAETGHALPTRIEAGAPRRSATPKPAAPAAVAPIDPAALKAAVEQEEEVELAFAY